MCCYGLDLVLFPGLELAKSEEMDFCMAIENNISLVSLNMNLFIFAYVWDVFV